MSGSLEAEARKGNYAACDNENMPHMGCLWCDCH